MMGFVNTKQQKQKKISYMVCNKKVVQRQMQIFFEFSTTLTEKKTFAM